MKGSICRTHPAFAAFWRIATIVLASSEALLTASSIGQGRGQFRIPLQRRRPLNDTSGGTGALSLLQTSATSRSHLERPRPRTEASANGSPTIDIFGQIRVGTPPQTFDVAIDTGSSNLLLTSALCRSSGCLSHKSYSAKHSSSAKTIHSLRADAVSQDSGPESVLLDISTGEAEGDLLMDNVCLGTDGDVCSMTGLVQMTRMTQAPFKTFPYDGILGVGMPQGSLGKRFNFISNLLEAGALKRDCFSVWMANDHDTEASEIIFGEVAEDHLASEVAWLPVSRLDTGMWQATMDDLSVDDAQLGMCGSEGCQAAFDTGTNAIAGPEHIISTVLAALNIQQDCSNYHSLPQLGLSFQGTVFNLDKSDYVKRVSTEQNVQCFHQFLQMELSGAKKDLILLGDPFLKKYYTVFDRESLHIGAALSKHKSI